MRSIKRCHFQWPCCSLYFSCMDFVLS